MTDQSCPFCSPEPGRVFYDGERVVGIWDAFPASPGHALLITRQHVAGWFDASEEEQAELLRTVSVAKAAVETRHRPDGYNIGINVGPAAGQTVLHLHVHVIPRYAGDVPDPRGGVRLAIPHKGNYLAEEASESTPWAESAGQQAVGSAPDTAGLLVRGGTSDPLLPHLLAELDRAIGVDIAAAFTLESGVRLIEEHLRDVLSRGGKIRYLTGDYLGVTEPNALARLLDLPGIDLRIFENDGTSFHPKSYILTRHEGDVAAFVGSSNLTASALRRGVEWNYRLATADRGGGIPQVLSAFDEIWDDPRVRPVDASWIVSYRDRRIQPLQRVAGLEPEPVGPPPEPHSVQQAALAALDATRTEGNTAGLVVLATGLGKTWLSAFDSNRPEFSRILFIAHREEILTQAMRTFRTIRPTATLGFYTGAEREPDADVLFASIQTLSRRAHLHRFDPRAFDYVIVDEFHHAAARSYRRVIGYLEPQFLLGLTATPERTDGGDLLSLCGDNLVYRCDVAEGINRGLLSPFDYYGVPDQVDYTNIPWRSSRFDEARLTDAVATHARARNALEQHERLGGTRTIGFCVSQRHADFMAESFREAGLRAIAVHSGAASAPRAHSLERLEAGDLDVVFAVDMFNEGVDLPHVDTVLMLRPTESRILWLQQFGRGLRYRPGKMLRVVDYIGNHRVFLNKARALFNLGASDREVAYALDRLDAGTQELPPGCSITYELEAKEILRSLLRAAPEGDRLRAYFEDFTERHGVRPLALEAFEDGYDPRAVRRDGYASWLDFARRLDALSPLDERLLDRFGDFLAHLEVTRMTRSYKMLVLLGMIAADSFPGSITIELLAERFAELARRYAPLRTEVGAALNDLAKLRALIEENPIAAWTAARTTGGESYFKYEDGVFLTTFSIPDDEREAFQDLARELAEWRLTAYLRRLPLAGRDQSFCSVSHSGGRPILFLPDRATNPGIPEGWQDIVADGQDYQANFVKIAVNVVTRPGASDNVLPQLLRGWFGEDAGQPGRTDAVVFQRYADRYLMVPADSVRVGEGPSLWGDYRRSDGLDALGIKPRGRELQSGIIRRPGVLVFFVTLDKGQMEEAYQYRDHFLTSSQFQWQSQNRTRQESELGQEIRHHGEREIKVHLFVRKHAKVGARTSPFFYCGTLDFVRWEGERPITVRWHLQEQVPERLWGELNIQQP